MNRKLLNLFAACIIGITSYAQKQVNCFIIDNPSTGNFDIYVYASGGSYLTEQWNDMVITFSTPLANSLGAFQAPQNNMPFPANSYALKTWTLAAQPSFADASRTYYPFAFAGNTNSFESNVFGQGQDATLPEGFVVHMGSVAKNGTSFADIEIHANSAVNTNPTVAANNAPFYIEIDNLEHSGSVAKLDIIHVNNRLNEPPVTPDPLAWIGGSEATTFEPTLADAARNAIIFQGPAQKTVLGEVTDVHFLEDATMEIQPGGGFKTTTATLDGNNEINIYADNTPSYGQYIGPAIPGTIQQYVGTDEGWRNMAFPVQSIGNLDLGGAAQNVNSAYTSYHATPANRDICGNFGNAINTVNIIQFEGGSTTSEPHEWHSPASVSSMGGTVGYSIFVGGSNFTTTGTVEVDGTFHDPSTVGTYDYQHTSPHASNINGASQGIFTGVGCPYVEQPADRKANWDGWALVGNPFPCGLDIDEFCTDNSIAVNNVRVWSKDESYAIVGGGGIDYQYVAPGAGHSIAPMQAFWVKLGSAGTSSSLAFNDDQRVFSTDAFLKTDPSAVELIAMNTLDSAANHVILSFDAMATKGYDQQYDSYVLGQPGNTTPQMGFHNTYMSNGSAVVAPLYSNTTQMPVQSDFYPVRFWSRSNGNFSFFLNADRLVQGWYVYVEDLKLNPGKLHDITASTYNFSYAVGDDPKRFNLHFSNGPLSISEASITSGSLCEFIPTEDGVVVKFKNMNGKANVSLTNATGQVVFSKENVDMAEEFLVPIMNAAPQFYIVNVSAQSGSQSMKIVK